MGRSNKKRNLISVLPPLITNETIGEDANYFGLIMDLILYTIYSSLAQIIENRLNFKISVHSFSSVAT